MPNKVEIGGVGDPSGMSPPRPGYVQVDLVAQPGIEVMADLCYLPFRDLDEIYMSHVLEHMDDTLVVPVLRSCRRALKAGGKLELFVPDLMAQFRKFLQAGQVERWGFFLKMIFGSQETAGQYHKTGFSCWRLAQCLSIAGFRDIDVKPRRRSERMLRIAGEQYVPKEVWAVAFV